MTEKKEDLLAGLDPVPFARTKTVQPADTTPTASAGKLSLLSGSGGGTSDGKESSESKCSSAEFNGVIFGGSRKGAKQFQEDSFFYLLSANGKVSIGGVMDGHGGYNGLLASNTARDVALEYFEANREACEKWSESHWKEQMLALFETMHNRIREVFVQDKGSEAGPSKASGPSKRYVDERGIVRNPNGDPIHGGTTGTIIAMVKDPEPGVAAWVVTANVGDSTAVLLPPSSKGKYEFLTVDHGPESQDEFMRIKAMNLQHKLLFVYDKTNVFRKYECPCVFLEHGEKDQTFVANPWGNGLHPTNVRYEPAVYAVTPRAVVKDSTCIAMTRALGDFYAHQFGLTFVPSISIRKIPPGLDYTIIMASDGVWDCWKYEDFHQYINDQLAKKLSLGDVGTNALNESITRAVTNFGAKHFDDACLVGWRLTGPEGGSSSSASATSASTSTSASTGRASPSAAASAAAASSSTSASN